MIGVSHEGGTAATNRALAASAAAGARTGAAHRERGVARRRAIAEIVVETVELDHSWCHTIGYLSPIVAAAAVGGHLSGRPLDADDVATSWRPGPRTRRARRRSPLGWPTCGRCSSSAPAPIGRPPASSCSRSRRRRGCRRRCATSRRSCTATCPSIDDSTGLVLILADRAARPERLERARQALAAAAVLGVRSAAILAADASPLIPDDLTPAGRLIVEEAPSLPAPVAALLGTATPLQLLTERLARARGTNPDPIRRDDPRYAASAAAAPTLRHAATRTGPRPSGRSCRDRAGGSPGA